MLARRGTYALAILLQVCASVLSQTTLAPESNADAPNIVMILADDLGYGELGCYGQLKIPTPHIDDLAARGVRFTQFYSASTVCAPTRCAFLTGRHTGHSAIRGNSELGGTAFGEPEGQWPLPDAEITLAEALKSRGYVSAIVGKWGLGGPGSEGHPNKQGFDFFFGYLCHRAAHNYYPTHLWRNQDVAIQRENRYFSAYQKLTQPPETLEGYARFRGSEYSPAVMLCEAKKFLESNRSKKFFLYFPTTLPHAALQAPQEYVDRFPAEWDATPYLGEDGYLPTPRPRATYAAMISYLDDSVGQIVEAIRGLGLEQKTLVLFTSDNGTTYNGGVDRVFFNSLSGLRGHKDNLYEGGIRVPMIACWPGRIGAGRVSNHIAAIYDLFATFIEFAGGAVPTETDGVSLVPELLARGNQQQHEYLYWEYPAGEFQQALRIGALKAIRPHLRDGDLRVELYDLERDPGERQDLAATRPDVIDRVVALMKSARRPSRLFPIPALDRE